MQICKVLAVVIKRNYILPALVNIAFKSWFSLQEVAGIINPGVVTGICTINYLYPFVACSMLS